jgi:hypothetical protein
MRRATADDLVGLVGLACGGALWLAYSFLPAWEGKGLVLAVCFVGLVIGLGVALAVLRGRERERGRIYSRNWCRGCGYNLRGNVSGRCPECGRAREEATGRG